MRASSSCALEARCGSAPSPRTSASGGAELHQPVPDLRAGAEIAGEVLGAPEQVGAGRDRLRHQRERQAGADRDEPGAEADGHEVEEDERHVGAGEMISCTHAQDQPGGGGEPAGGQSSGPPSSPVRGGGREIGCESTGSGAAGALLCVLTSTRRPLLSRSTRRTRVSRPGRVPDRTAHPGGGRDARRTRGELRSPPCRHSTARAAGQSQPVPAGRNRSVPISTRARHARVG